MRTQEQVNEIVRRLLAEYPEAVCALDYDKDYELLFSVRLSAQCTDARVNMVTPDLFARYPTLEAFAEADVEEVEKYIHSCGFYHAKARDLVNCAIALLEKHGFKVRAIQVMDASRRSTKSNAYFTGFGKMKTIHLVLVG